MKIEANPMSVAMAVAGGLLLMLGGCDVDRGVSTSATLDPGTWKRVVGETPRVGG